MNNVTTMVMESGIHAAALTENYKPSKFRLLWTIARAIEALHVEAPKTEFFRDYPDRYMGHCILMAYALRDVLRKIDLPASVTPCSLAVTREDRTDGSLTRLVMVGDPREEQLPGRFNGHLVVRSGRLLIDPVAGQAGRIWNHWHTAMICSVARRPLTWTDPLDGERFMAFSNGGHRIPNDASLQRWAYLRRPDLEGDDTWSAAPDALPERRKDLVARTLETYRRGVAAVLLKVSDDLRPFTNRNEAQVFEKAA